jgi:hypothetical protein
LTTENPVFWTGDIPAAVSMVKKIDQIDRAGCRRVFEDRFTAARMAADYVALYTQLISEETIPLEGEFSGASEAEQKPRVDLKIVRREL